MKFRAMTQMKSDSAKTKDRKSIFYQQQPRK